MSYIPTEETVAAVSTAYGRGGVAVVRVSGKDAFSAVQKVFSPKSGKALSEYPFRRAIYGDILFEGEVIDEGLLLLFPAPGSYTGEDCAEISCHGGVLITQKVLQAVLNAGAKPAGPGEFTKRAFINGKLSLSGAEAVMDLINAESDTQLRLAAENARGSLSRACESVYERLTALLAQLYVLIDYPDEDLTDMSEDEFEKELCAIRDALRALNDSYKAGRAVMEGVPAVIVGRPNVGKSSLLNLLLGRDRAIVSPVSGTTRDTVEESLPLGKVLLRIADTAGLHETSDPVEKLGVERTLEKLESAELVLAVFDGSESASKEDLDLIECLRARRKQVIALINKSDLPAKFDAALLSDFYTVSLSTLRGVVPGELQTHVEELYQTEILCNNGRAVLTNARQAQAASEALCSVERAIEQLQKGEPRDMAALDAEEALRAIGRLDGKSVEEDLVHNIFSRFCVGK